MYTYSHFISLYTVEQLYPIFFKAYTYPDVIIRFRNFYLIDSRKSGTLFKWIISMIYICYLKIYIYIYIYIYIVLSASQKTVWKTERPAGEST